MLMFFKHVLDSWPKVSMMVATPELHVGEDLRLRPAANTILVAMFEAYQEDAEAAQVALPWLDPNEDVRRQLRDMLYDIEAQNGNDRLHFWSVHTTSTDEFVGLLAAPDASERELRRLSSRLGVEWVTQLFSAEELGSIFGRDSLAFVGVHAGRSRKLAESLRCDMDRLGAFSASSGCQAG
mgnify:CR=1 FL=1